MLGTVQTYHHLQAGLSDTQARQLEGDCLRFYRRVLELMLVSNCSYDVAYAAVLAATEQEKRS